MPPRLTPSPRGPRATAGGSPDECSPAWHPSHQGAPSAALPQSGVADGASGVHTSSPTFTYTGEMKAR